MADALRDQFQASLYYARRRGLKAPRPSDYLRPSGNPYGGASYDNAGFYRAEQAFNSGVQQSGLDAAQTIARRERLAAAQGADGKGDLTDTVIQDAGAMERRRRQVGRTRASSFLGPNQSIIGGGY